MNTGIDICTNKSKKKKKKMPDSKRKPAIYSLRIILIVSYLVWEHRLLRCPSQMDERHKSFYIVESKPPRCFKGDRFKSHWRDDKKSSPTISTQMKLNMLMRQNVHNTAYRRCWLIEIQRTSRCSKSGYFMVRVYLFWTTVHCDGETTCGK